MYLGLVRGGFGASVSPVYCRILTAASALILASALAACTTDGQSGPASLSAAGQPRGASVAFDSIDGLPPGQFQTLVRNLNDEAQTRRLAVISRENTSAYRVRGYLSAKVMKDRGTISWVWDVFDRDEHRALRIEGEEIASKPVTNANEAWNVADDAMLRRIANSSMGQLASFLNSAEASPDAQAQVTPVAFMGLGDSSPEAAGIFRIFHANADPVAVKGGEPSASGEDLSGAAPLPPRRTGEPALAKPVTQRSASL